MATFNHVKRCREARSLTRDDLATLANISSEFLQAVEEDGGELSVGVALRLAQALGVTVEPLSAQAANVRATATMQAAAIYFFMLNIPFTILFYGFIIYKKHVTVK